MNKGDAKPVVLIGAGRHGRNVLDVCFALGRPVAGFLDDTLAPGTEVLGHRVLGGFDAIEDMFTEPDAEVYVALGDNAARRRMSERVVAAGRELANIIHPTTIVPPSVVLGRGIFMSAYCVLRPETRIGDGLLLEGHSGIGARAEIGDYVGTGPNIHITADVHVGEEAFLGASVTITNRAHVGARTVIGAGATVLSDIADDTFAVGTPALVIDRPRPDPHAERNG